MNDQPRKLTWPIAPLNIQYQGPALTGLACAAVSPRGTEFVIVAEDQSGLDLILTELRAARWDQRFIEPVQIIKNGTVEWPTGKPALQTGA